MSRAAERPDGARRRRLERWVVALVALHSAAIGGTLLAVPARALALGGLEVGTSTFFPRQAGVFHLIVAFGYWWELERYGGVALLVVAKAMAVAFLVGCLAAGETARVIPLAALGDALLGTTVVLLHRRARRGGSG